MRMGIGIGELALGAADGSKLTLDTLVEQARLAEQQGFDSVWVANIFGLDALTALTVVGRAVPRVKLGTGVVPTFPRHPVALAQQALSVQAATGNRLQLGIGLSHKIVIENMLGMSWAKPYSHMKAYLSALSPLIHQGKCAIRGDEFNVIANLSVPGAEPCPILLAALAPKMLALAGSQADGTVTWMTGERTLRDYVVPRITQAAAEAGRPAPRIGASLPIAVCDDEAEGRAEAGRRFAVYGTLPSYRAMLDREGAEGPADVALVGDESAVRARLEALREAGVTDFVSAEFPVGDDASASLERTRALLVECL